VSTVNTAVALGPGTLAPPIAGVPSRRTYLLVCIGLVVVVAAFAIWPVLTGESNQVVTVVTDVAECVMAAAAAAATAWRAYRTRRVGWLLVSLASLAWFTGQTIWTSYEVGTTRAPFPSAADVAFLATIPLVLAGFLFLGFGTGSREGIVHRLTEAAVVASSLLFVSWETTIGEIVRDGPIVGAERVLLLSYPLGDIAVVTAALVAVLNRRSRAVELAAVGVIFLGVADSLYAYQQNRGTFSTGSLPDLLWLCAFAFITLAGLRPESASSPTPRTEVAARSLLGYAPVLAAVAVGVWRLRSGGPPDNARGAMIVAIGLAVLANQLSQYVENSTLNRRLRRHVDELKRSEERFRLVLDDLAEAVLVVGGDGVVRYASHQAETMFGRPAAAIEGMHVRDLVHPEDEATILDAFAAVLARRQRPGVLVVRASRPDGEVRWLEADASNLLRTDAVSGVVFSLRDVTERRQRDAALREAQTRFRVAFEAAPIGMTLSTVEGTIIEVNAALGRMLGYSPEQLIGRNVGDITHPDDAELTSTGMLDLSLGLQRTFQVEKRYIRADGRIVWASLSVSFVDQPDGAPLIIGQIEDVTQRKAIAERLEYSARHDEVTGLFNRAHFMDRLERALARRDRTDERVAVIFLDLDRFKVVNDSLGHAAGDELLRIVAHRLQRAVRSVDVVARFGGDEFTVLLVEPPDDADVMSQANRIARVIADPVPLTDGETYITASIGVAVAERPGADADRLVQDADAAMYRAKERGRNRIERFDAAARASVVRRLRTGNDLHRALQRHEFRVEYQPVMALASGRLIGFEALARWEHPDRGMITPEDFIDLAEETGLIVPIGFAVMREAFGQVAAWSRRDDVRAAGGLTVAANLSARQLAAPGLVGTVAEVISSSGIDADNVWLEITESALLTDAKSTLVALRALRGIGVHLTVDDFGTGYSSLTYLQRFPVEGLKIDRSFVDGLGVEANDTTIVDTLVHLGHSLGLSVVAEGLETPLQLNHLRQLGCDNAQGYLFSRPLPANAVEDELGEWLHAAAARL
jgi:diguanylate cyclase (GGDEF)-like protein/PAS domain S-box-containing protein